MVEWTGLVKSTINGLDPVFIVEPSRQDLEICLAAHTQPVEPMIDTKQYSSFSRMLRVTSWVLRFISRCRVNKPSTNHLATAELAEAEAVMVRLSQNETFLDELVALAQDKNLPRSSCLAPSSYSLT